MFLEAQQLTSYKEEAKQLHVLTSNLQQPSAQQHLPTGSHQSGAKQQVPFASLLVSYQQHQATYNLQVVISNLQPASNIQQAPVSNLHVSISSS